MIDCLVFSRDRPLQLDGLLASIAEHAPDLFSSVTVLYRPTSLAFAAAYLECADDHPDVAFRHETVFETDVRDGLDDAGDHVCFLMDDNLFVRKPPSRTLPKDADVCFTLRLQGGRWDWRQQENLHGRRHDGAYVFGLEGSVFRRDLIVPLLTLPFSNPNHLEGVLMGQRERVEARYMAAPRRQCIVGIPANRVSDSSRCAHDGRDEWSPDALLVAYAAGFRLDREAMRPDLVAAVGTHPAVELRFTPTDGWSMLAERLSGSGAATPVKGA